MSLVANPFLSDRSLKIRAKAIPWDVRPLSPPPSATAKSPARAFIVMLTRRPHRSQGYQRAGLLGQDDVQLIQRVAASRDKAEPILDAVRPSLPPRAPSSARQVGASS